MATLVFMLVHPILVAVWMRMAHTIGVRMLMLVEHDLQALAKDVGDAAEGP